MEFLFASKAIKLAYGSYRTYLFKSQLLEIIAIGGSSVSFPYILKQITVNTRPHNKIQWDSTPSTVQESLIELVKLGFVMSKGDKDIEYHITHVGIEAIQNATFQNLANSAFFGYKSLIISRNTLLVSFLALIVALVSLFI